MSRAAPVRLSELVATLSLVADLGMGRPMERVLRQTVIALRLADAAGADDSVRAAAYYTSLLTWVGCAADTSELAALFGDETELYADSHDGDLAGVAMAMFVLRHLGRGGPRLRRAALVGRFLATAGRSVQQIMQAHCQSASELAGRLDLGEDVCRPLLQSFERWDGRGVPGDAGGADLDLAIRLVQLADNVEAFHDTAGVDGAVAVARERRGTQFDPALVDCFLNHRGDILAGLDRIRAWDEVIALDPRLGAALAEDELDRALQAFADFADLKSPPRLGHSRGVASLAADGATRLGLPAPDVRLVRRAGWVHDIGMIGVPSAIWNATQPWTLAQAERARTHPYLTERMLAGMPGLAAVARCAAQHHERLDGSGYPHGLSGDALPMTSRVLAAADVYHALGEPRPHRAALASDAAARLLTSEAHSGRLDADAVSAVLVAAGQRVRRTPAGLTARETEVLLHLARGLSNPEIAAALTVSRKTVSTHLEHIYAKLGVTTRTQAALVAMHRGLTG
ncbi:HD domain-containing phosphohydrolase [Amycolatopsis echigonensis]|uniref:HD domain-containing protein n=1 Tax=Amycolatopsis echigonensis TaxID=2576905 RepID=A0A8E1W472_9PSEU|nr:HD domain-containing phosphohydrolase [Amycolatopsis echigonensis]MBB2503696.1 HD domain-containing protein [Amycolatopsis echigonensis]